MLPICFQVYHDGTDSYINNGNDGGHLYIQNDAVDKDIVFKSDDGAGGTTTYFSLDGSQSNVNFQKSAIFADNKKALFGGSGDLQIYHDGSNSYIHDSGTGHLNIKATNLQLLNAAGNKYYLTGADGNDVKIFHNGVEKFTTVAGGVNITGELEADSLDIDGNADISGIISGNFVVRSTNNSNVDGANFSVDTTNKSSSEYAYEVLRSGTTVAGITTVGKITGTELEGTSLDINGNGDVSGTLTVHGALTANAGITGLDSAGGISGNNYNITGVNQLTINDPGEGIVFTGTTNVQLFTIDDATDSILKITSATALDVNAKITNLSPGSTNLEAVNYQQLTDAVAGVLVYQGTWNASTNTPALASGVGTPGYYYIVSTAGSTNLDGITDWNVGDWAIFSDQATDAWQKIDHTNVLNGAGTGNKVTKWSGSGTSYTLTDSIITDDGTSVGIGNNNPTGRLDINYTGTGGTGILGIGEGLNITSLSPNITFNDTSSGIDDYAIHLNQSVFTLGRYTSSTAMSPDLVLKSGSVGIGTTSPGYKLDIASSGTNEKLLRLSHPTSPSDAGFMIGFNTDGTTDNNVISLGVEYSSTDYDVINIQRSTRNVGIGTTNPGYKLEVNGTARVTSRLTLGGNVNNFIEGTGSSLDFKSNGEYYFKKGASTHLTILSGGNVGIGTTSPGYKLDVVGNAYISTTLQVNGNINFYDDLIGTSFKQGTTAVRNKRLKNIILESSTETNQAVVHPYFNNSLGNFIAKGGTITFGNITTPPTLSQQNLMFQPNQNFMGLTASNITASTWSMTLTSTNSGTMNFNYGCWIGITFGSASFDPDSCLIEVNTNADGSGTWTTALNSTVSDTGYFTYYASGGTGIKSIRFTMGQTSQGPRVCNIYAYNYSASGMNEFFLSKAGGYVFGDIMPGTDYLSGGTYLPKLGGTGNRWNEAYINKLADINNSFGTSGQVLSSNSSGQLDWISGSSLPGGPYLALVGGTMTGNTLHGDNVKSNYGSGNDLQIFHNGTNSHIETVSASSGDLYIKALGTNHDLYLQASDNVYIRPQNGEDGIIVVGDGGVQLYYNDVRKFETTNTGVTVTGNGIFTGNVGIGTTTPQTELQVVYTDTHTSGDLSLSNSAFDIYNDSTTDVAGKGSTLTFSDNYSGTNKTTRAAIKGGTEDAGNTANGFLAFYTDSGGANSMQERIYINEVGAIKFNNYDSTNRTGTPTYLLGTDGSGNIVKTNTIPGSAAGPYLPLAGGTLSGNLTVDGGSITVDPDAAGAVFTWKESDSTTVAGQLRGYANRGDIYLYSDGVKKTELSSLNDSFIPALHIGGTTAASGGVLQVTGTGIFTGNVGIGTASPSYKLDVSGGMRAGGKLTYSKSAGSLSTTGYAVAGLLAGSNGNSCMFTFTAIGNTGHYQKVVYSCWNAGGTWNTSKVIDEGTNGLDIEASTNASTITFTFKSRSGSLNYSPRVTIEASGHAINNTYA